jgi:hypothetical protein
MPTLRVAAVSTNGRGPKKQGRARRRRMRQAPTMRPTANRTRFINNKMAKMSLGVDRKVFGTGRQIATTEAGAQFARCTLDPLAAMSMKSQGVPDKYSGETIVVDHKMDITITPNATGAISLAILPTLPGALHVYCDGTNTPANITGKYTAIDGTLRQLDVTGSGASQGYACIPFQEYVPSTPAAIGLGTPLPNMNVYSAARARCVALGMELVDKATDLNSQGDVTITQVPIRIGQESIVGQCCQAGRVSSLVGNYWQRTVDTPIVNDSQATNVKNYVCMKPKEGVYAVGKRSSPEWSMKPFAPMNSQGTSPLNGTWTGQFFGPVTSDFASFSAGASSLQYYNYAGGDSADSIGWSWADPDTQGIFATLTGLNTTTPQPIRVLVTMCVEYELQSTSSISKFTGPSPKEDQKALKTVSDAQSMMPPAVKGTQKQGFFGSLISALGSAARGIAGAHIPIISDLASGANAIVGAFVPEWKG